MEVVIVVLVVIGALFAVASGVWVAIALISAISGMPQRLPPQDGATGHRATPLQANESDAARPGSAKPRQERREPKSSD